MLTSRYQRPSNPLRNLRNCEARSCRGRLVTDVKKKKKHELVVTGWNRRVCYCSWSGTQGTCHETCFDLVALSRLLNKSESNKYQTSISGWMITLALASDPVGGPEFVLPSSSCSSLSFSGASIRISLYVKVYMYTSHSTI